MSISMMMFSKSLIRNPICSFKKVLGLKCLISLKLFFYRLFSLIALSSLLQKFYVYLCKAWHVLCIIHPAVSSGATGAVLYEHKVICWKFMDDSASFFQISNDFSSWKKIDLELRRELWKGNTNKNVFQDLLFWNIFPFKFSWILYFIAILFQVSFAGPNQFSEGWFSNLLFFFQC